MNKKRKDLLLLTFQNFVESSSSEDNLTIDIILTSWKLTYESGFIPVKFPSDAEKAELLTFFNNILTSRFDKTVNYTNNSYTITFKQQARKDALLRSLEKQGGLKMYAALQRAFDEIQYKQKYGVAMPRPQKPKKDYLTGILWGVNLITWTFNVVGNVLKGSVIGEFLGLRDKNN